MERIRAKLWQSIALLAAALLFIVCGMQIALAEDSSSFSSDGIVYSIKDDSTVYVGTGLSGQPALESTSATDVVIPENVTHDGKTYTVTRVNPYAFYGCKQLKSVTLPKTVTMIGSYAFAECGTMTGEKKAATYTGLTTLNLPNDTQLAQINSNAFLRCYALRTFTFPKSVKLIGESAFKSCYSFTQFKCEAESQLASIGDSAFEQELPAVDKDALEKDGITKDEVLELVGTSEDSYGGMTSVEIPAKITQLGSYAFANQRELTDIAFDAKEVPYLGSSMFAFCTSLEEAEIPALPGYQYRADTRWALGQETFSYCSKLKTFVFGGDIGTTSGRYSGLDFFAGDYALSTVVYKGKECLPAYNWHAIVDAGSVVDKPIGDASSWSYGIPDSKPTFYYQVTFYKTEADAKAKRSPIGSACVRKGTVLGSINSSMAISDANGAVIFEGNIPEYVSGCNAWAFESGDSSSGLSDSLYAYGVDSNDLSYGSIVIPNSKIFYTGHDVKPQVTVHNAQGVVIDASNYTLTWERKTGNAWAATSDFTSIGDVRCTATATNNSGLKGSVSAEFSIGMMSKGDTFTKDGITFVVTSTNSSKNPTVQVGNGTGLAIDGAFEGEIVIPARVSPDGSAVSFEVAAIADYAFGSKDAEKACAGITGIELPSSVSSIGIYAFANCTSLQSATLNGSLSSIGVSAFYNCRSLKTLQLKGKKIGSISANAFARCTALTDLSLPAITKFEGNAFANCARLKNIIFRGSIKTKASTQFSGCQSLVSVTYLGANWGYSFPSNCIAYRVTSAAKKTCSLAYCGTKSTTTTVVANVKISGKTYKLTGVDARAFAKSKCKTVTIKSKDMKSFKNAFAGSKVTTVKVPASKKSVYKKLLTKKVCGKVVKVK